LNNKNKELIDEVRKVFSSLSLMVPFAYPLIGWPIIFNNNVALAATNGTSIILNETKWCELQFREKLFIALHEWLHVALMHPKRLRTRRHRIFNYAADFVNNYMIAKDLPQFDMPCGLYDTYYGNMSVEEVYKDLDKEVKKRQDESIDPFCDVCNRKFSKDDYKDGCHKDPDIKKCPACSRPTLDGKPIPEPEVINREMAINQLMVEQCGAPWGNDLLELPHDADEQKIIDEVIKAAARFKSMGRGTLPGHFEEYINQLKRSEIPWHRILMRFAREFLKGGTDRNPYKPDPKYLPFDVFVPTEIDNHISKLVLIVDTSGSMDSEEFEYAAGHIKKLGTICNNLILITADTKVQEIIKVKISKLKFQIKPQ